MSTFEEHCDHWTQRRDKLGDASVGRKDEDHIGQGERISEAVARWLNGSRERFFRHGLDFGCGWGRITPVLARSCEHVWAADIFEEWADRAATVAPTVSSVHIQGSLLPLDSGTMDLVLDCMTLQDMTGQLLMDSAKELRRVSASGAVIISLGRAATAGGHSPAPLAELLGMKPGWLNVPLVGIDAADEAYMMLCGQRL